MSSIKSSIKSECNRLSVNVDDKKPSRIRVLRNNQSIIFKMTNVRIFEQQKQASYAIVFDDPSIIEYIEKMDIALRLNKAVGTYQLAKPSYKSDKYDNWCLYALIGRYSAVTDKTDNTIIPMIENEAFGDVIVKLDHLNVSEDKLYYAFSVVQGSITQVKSTSRMDLDIDNFVNEKTSIIDCVETP